jgi:hypothetical protein
LALTRLMLKAYRLRLFGLVPDLERAAFRQRL